MKAKYLALMIGACFSHNLGQRIISLLSSVWLNWSNVLLMLKNGHPMPRRKFAR